MIRLHNLLAILLATVLSAVASCNGNRSASTFTDPTAAQTMAVIAPDFNADSAYAYVKAQVDFGPRVPGTAAHEACGNYLASKLEQFGAKVYNQYADLATYDGHLIRGRNIIGAYRPDLRRRLALFAHWDSRPWADQDPDASNHYKPILGANDGASGVGVLLEIARQLQAQSPEIGIDLVLLDAEDYGTHSEYQGQRLEEHWCLGSQYWARSPHVEGYNARYGILLDMVGGRDATFRYEMMSEEFAPELNRKVWRAAAQLGFGDYFVRREGNYTTDDHIFINRYARIPTIDIIAYSDDHTFFEHWHTLRDNMDAIDARTLKAVGQTVMQVIYNEK